MKFKILVILLSTMLIFSSIVVSANFKLSKRKILQSEQDNIIEIKVAIYTDEIENEEFHSEFMRTRYFVYALRNYNWTVNNTSYGFKVNLLSTKELNKGELTTENYDVLIYPPGTFDKKLTNTYLSKLHPHNILEKKRIRDFIKEGGGFFGTCAGAIIAGEMVNKPETLWEKMFQNAMLDISDVNCNVQYKMPLVHDVFRKKIEMSPKNAYYWYSGANQSDYDINFHTATCLDVEIDKNNPIFDDCIGNKRKVRWIGGTDLIVPEDSDRDIKVLSRFPAEEMSENESTEIHYWRYTGGLLGILRGMFPAGTTHHFNDFGPIWNTLIYSQDWELTDEKVITNYTSKPFMTSEIYPNSNKARIVRCTGHLEHNVWWGGHIEDVEDTDNNRIYDGLYKWKDIIPENETEEDEFSYNYCLLRRSVAWVSQKVPDNYLPVVYGESEVCDFEENMTSSEFMVYGNSETADGIVSLDLYYRHSDNNINWNNWTLYGTDNDESDGWSWDFSSPNGTGFYQFYSRRVVDFGESVELEKMPPGADACVYVNLTK